MKRHVILLALTASITLGCPRAKDAPKKQEKPESAERDGGDHDHEGLPKVVHLSPEVFRAANLDVAPAKREVLRATLLLPGEIAANPDRSGRISSTVAGRIEEVKFQEGATVKKGDVVAVLRVPDLGKIRGAFSSATSRAKAARTNADRLKDLAENRLASNQAYLDAEAEAQSLDAETKAFAEQLAAVGAGSSSGSGFLLGLRAPVSGVVVRREAVVGQPVTADQTLGSIADLSEAWFLARVFEKDLGPAPTTERPPRSSSTRIRTKRSRAPSSTSSQQIDPVARTLTARIGLTNRNGLLRVGLFGTARVDVGDGRRPTPRCWSSRARPSRRSTASRSCSFVHEPETTSRSTRSMLGESAVGKVHVVAGLQEGEPVVDARRLHAQERRPQGHLRGGRVHGTPLRHRRAGRCAIGAIVLVATLLFVRRRRPLGATRCRSTPCPTSPTSRSRSSPPRRRSRPSRSSSTSPCPVERADGRAPEDDAGPLDLEVRPLGRHGRVPRRHRHLLRAPARRRAHARGRATRVLAQLRHARDGPDLAPASARSTSSSSATTRTTLMQIEEMLDWQIAPAAAHRARRRRGQQLRRRGPAVPGRARPEAAAGAAGVSVAQVVEALAKSNANAGGGYIEHNQRALRHRHRRPRAGASTTSARRHRRDAAGRAHHDRDGRRRALRAAAPPRRRDEGRQGRGRRRRRADAHGRELAHRHRRR